MRLQAAFSKTLGVQPYGNVRLNGTLTLVGGPQGIKMRLDKSNMHERRQAILRGMKSPASLLLLAASISAVLFAFGLGMQV